MSELPASMAHTVAVSELAIQRLTDGSCRMYLRSLASISAIIASAV